MAPERSSIDFLEWVDRTQFMDSEVKLQGENPRNVESFRDLQIDYTITRLIFHSIGLQFFMAHTGFRSGGIQSDLVLGPTARQIPAMVEGHRLDIGSNQIASLCETIAESTSHWHIVS